MSKICPCTKSHCILDYPSIKCLDKIISCLICSRNRTEGITFVIIYPSACTSFRLNKSLLVSFPTISWHICQVKDTCSSKAKYKIMCLLSRTTCRIDDGEKLIWHSRISLPQCPRSNFLDDTLGILRSAAYHPWSFAKGPAGSKFTSSLSRNMKATTNECHFQKATVSAQRKNWSLLPCFP